MTFFNQWTSQEKRTSYQLRPAISCSRSALFQEMFPRVNPNTSNLNLDKAQKMSNFDCKKNYLFSVVKVYRPAARIQSPIRFQNDLSKKRDQKSSLPGASIPSPH